MLCTIGMKNCTIGHRMTRTHDRCERCGFNLDEYNRRIEDIRTNGLKLVGKNRWGACVMGYVVKHGPERMKRYVPTEKEESNDGV